MPDDSVQMGSLLSIKSWRKSTAGGKWANICGLSPNQNLICFWFYCYAGARLIDLLTEGIHYKVRYDDSFGTSKCSFKFGAFKAVGNASTYPLPTAIAFPLTYLLTFPSPSTEMHGELSWGTFVDREKENFFRTHLRNQCGCRASTTRRRIHSGQLLLSFRTNPPKPGVYT